MAADILKESFLPPKFVGWRESIERLEKIKRDLRGELAKSNGLEFLPSWCLFLALLGEIMVLKTVNDGKLNCPLPWNEEIRFPSPPSFSADAKKSAEFAGENPKLQAILKSFSGWQVFSKEIKEGCACGLSAFKTRDVAYDVLVNHIVVADGQGVLVKQLFAIRSDDRLFLSEHFNDKNGRKNDFSRVLPDANIVWLSENRVEIAGNQVKLASLKLANAKEIYDPAKPGDTFVCGEQAMEFSKEMEEIYERSKGNGGR